MHRGIKRQITAAARQISGRGGRSSFHPDVICLSHLRWHFVVQRPQHLMVRCARDRRVFFVEEPMYGAASPHLAVERDSSGVHVVVPQLPDGLTSAAVVRHQQRLLQRLVQEWNIKDHVLWYWTPMAMSFTRALEPSAVVFDCMDELSAFAYAPGELLRLENELFTRADLVFTGGRSLFEAKRTRHPRVYAFPSSVDVPHFARARAATPEPADQATIAGPRLGFFGVVDERMDLALLDGIARLRPEWSLVIIGPTVKIDAATLPHRPNIHYLGGRDYQQLPAYLAGWQVAMLPFALNESTRFISPTKTPEYLAAGRPVVSTSVRDVVHPYGELGLVRIADSPEAFVKAAECAMREDGAEWLARVDVQLAHQSWDLTWSRMRDLIDGVIEGRRDVGRPSTFPVASTRLMPQTLSATSERSAS